MQEQSTRRQFVRAALGAAGAGLCGMPRCLAAQVAASEASTPTTVDCPKGIAPDWRNLDQGRLIPTPGMKYTDQPYVVTLADGRWLCMLTVGTLGETIRGSRNFSAVTISADQGTTWTPFRQCNVPYAVPLRVPSGRIYAIRPPLGFTFSDDHGATWSERFGFPPDVALVRGHRNGWSVTLPVVHQGAVYLAWAYIGLNSPPRQTEVFLYCSENLLTESDPKKILWQRLPAGDVGLRGPDWDQPEHRSEEPHLAVLSDGTFYCVWRTDQGYIGQATSPDAGKTWTRPDYVRYRPGGRRIKHPLACPSLWKCSNGKYLLWIHNHSGKTYADRNPAWICGGVERGGTIEWSQPEILLYCDDLTQHAGRISYPGMLETGGRCWIFETQKTIARVHDVDAALLEAAWGQHDNRSLATEGLLLDLRGEPIADKRVAMPRLPDLATRAGFTIELRLTLKDLEPGQVVIDSRGAAGAGIHVATTEAGTLRLELSDGARRAAWDCDPSLLEPGKTHQVALVVDGGPKIISTLVDGQLCDGGRHRQFGWGRFHASTIGGEDLRDVTGGPQLRLAPSLHGDLLGLRIYGRALRTSEAVGNFRNATSKR